MGRHPALLREHRQPDFTERTDAANLLVGIEVYYRSAPAFADLDGDGDLDLVVGETDGDLHYYENTGSRSQPTFTERTDAANPLDDTYVSEWATPTFADLDGDGDLDLVVGETDGDLHYYENIGSRSQPDFTERTSVGNPLAGIDVGRYSTPTFADLDGDGDLDLVVGETHGTLHYYENTGSRSQPTFTARAGAANPLDGIDVGGRSAPTFADLDNDGDLDLVVGEADGDLNYYENTGTSTNAEFNPNSLEIADYLTDGYWEMDWRSRRAFNVEPGGTLTADITTLTPAGQQFARWALEAWTAVTGIGFEFVDGAAHITFDDENVEHVGGYAESNVSDSEILSSYVSVWKDSLPVHATIDSYALYTYLHEIGHALGLGHPGPYGGEGVTYSDHAKFLNDSWQMTVMSYFNQEENTYIEASYATPVTPMIADIIALQDLYGAPTNINLGDTVYGYRSNVDGYLGQLFALWTGAENPFTGIDVCNHSRPTFADLDDDGDLDLVAGADDGTLYYYENTDSRSQPGFTERTGAANPLDGIDVGTHSAPTFADLDNDGDLDLVVGGEEGILHYYENTDSRSQPDFTERTGAANPLDGIKVGFMYSTPTFADLDNDGDLDLVVGEWDGTLYYYENTGSHSQPNFTERIGADNPLDGIKVGDRHTPDFIVNNGVLVSQSTPTFADLDGDGDLDLVAGAFDGTLYYYENTGSHSQPNFTQRTGAANPLDEVDVGDYSAPAFADLDGDGVLDLVSGESWNYLNYHENTGTRTETSFTSLLGLNQPVALTLYDNGGNDTLDLRTDKTDQRVDLRPEGISDVYGLTGNLVIARGTVIEHFIAGSGNDTVTGNSAANRLEGRDGNDNLRGKGGNDVLEGGAGADLLSGGAGMDTVSYQGSDAGVAVKLREGTGKRGHAEGDVIAEVENVIGSDHNDTLVGDSLDNLLTGNAGNDLLWGSAGNDLLIGGPGADRLVGNSGHDTAAYTHSPTGVTVRLHNLSATGGDATGDTFPYRVDVAWTDSNGVEQTESLPDVEHLSGSAHDDVLAGDRRDNSIDGGAGHDTLYGGPGGGDDRLDGGPGDDRLYGGAGRDRLAGAAGDDQLVGGPGADVFVVAPGEGEDIVTDFTDGEDRIDLTAFGLAGIDDITTTTTTDGVALDLTDSGGGTILLADFAMASLDATDFII